VEENVDSEVAENNDKTDGKVAETKRPKRQAVAVDKPKVTIALLL